MSQDNSTQSRRLLLVVVIVTLINTALITSVWFGFLHFDQTVSELQTAQEALDESIIGGATQIASQTTETDTQSITSGSVQDTRVLAVDRRTNSGTSVGLQIRPLLSDNIYISIDDIFVRQNTQESIKNAVSAVKQSQYSLPTQGYVIRFTAPERWENIGGESASTSIAVALASFSDGVTYDNSVVATGELTPAGDVQQVAGISQKIAYAEQDSSIDTVIIPPQPTSVYDNADVTVIEAQTIDDVLDVALSKEPND